MVTVFVHGIFQAQDALEEGVAYGAEFKAGGEEALFGIHAFCQTIEVIGGVAGGGIEAFGVMGDDIVISKGLFRFGFGHRFKNGVEDHHVVARAVAGMNVNMDDILVIALQALSKYTFEVCGGGFVAVSTVIHALRIFILAAQQRIRNGGSALGDGVIAQIQIEVGFVPKGVANGTGGAKKGVHLGVVLIGGKVKGVPIQNEIAVQVHIVFVVAAHIFHAIGVYIGYHKDAGGIAVNIGIDIGKEYIQHGAADITLHAVDTGGQ